MTSPDDPRPTDPDELDPITDEQVRALLAAAPAPRIPGDVASRLQSVIHDESQARSQAWGSPPSRAPGHAGPPSTNVRSIESAPSRRRRWMAPLVAAAAVVAVVAVAVPVINQQSDDTSNTAGDRQTSEAKRSNGDEGGSADNDDAAPEQKEASPSATAPAGPGLSLTKSRYADDVTTKVIDPGLAPRPLGEDELESDGSFRPSCSGDRVKASASLRVTVDGQPGNLVVFGPDDARVYEVWTCATGAAQRLASATID